MVIHVPTYEDYRAHDGLHYRNLWRQIDDTWKCPGCGRTKFQIMRWTTRFPRSPAAFGGWVAALHRHHDHGGQRRFAQTVICDQCNSADGVAKRKLKLPANFSFSPEEIGLFITAIPHGRHSVHCMVASIVYEAVANVDHRVVRSSPQAQYR